MLPLTDPAWDKFETIYDDLGYGKLSVLLEDWWAAVGFDHEEENYYRLMKQIMHQGSITTAAYALVPYLVELCSTSSNQCSHQYLRDIAWIELQRLTPGYAPEVPDFLVRDYTRSVESAANLFEDFMVGKDREEVQELIALLPAIHGNPKLAWKRWGHDVEL